jgi:hypothetical protein
VIRKLSCGLVLAAILLTPTACTSGSADGKSSAPSTPPTASSSSASPPSSSSPAATDPAIREAADRRAVETAWTNFWQDYAKLTKLPSADLVATVERVAVDPIRKEMIAGAKVARSAHRTDYGYVVNHPYWQQRINGATKAVLGDCQDQSHYGSMSTTTGQKLTVGVAHDNMRGSLVKDSDGVWRVETIVFLRGTKC